MIDYPALGPKDPSELKAVTFDFTNQLGAATIVSAALSIEVYQGIDASPSSMLSGAAVVNPATVVQKYAAGVQQVTYLLHCLVTDTAGLKHRVSASLLVLPV
jgi:hypothetical protein